MAELNLEKQDLNNLSVYGLAKAYSDDEPDYSNIVIKELNPELVLQ